MLDCFGAIPPTRQDCRIFEVSSTRVSGSGFQVWEKPVGASMVSMLAIGGGGGGASAGLARFIIPAALLPNRLYVQVGEGGVGGAAGAAGTSGTISYILYNPTTIAAPNIVLNSTATAPGGGGGGTGAAAGTAPVAPTIAATATPNAAGWWFATVGLAGVAGGVHTGAVGTSVTAWAANPLSPGAGGAGCTAADFQGGSQTATALTNAVGDAYHIAGAGNLIAGAAGGTGINGGSGYKRLAPFLNCGGAGGGSFNAGAAGAGGNGGYGCGGGGGGAGTTGGRGGNGGNGLVIIVSW